MKKVINGNIGDSVKHMAFGSGVIKEINDSFIVIDFPDRIGFEYSTAFANKVTIEDKPLVQYEYDSEVSDYTIHYTYHAIASPFSNPSVNGSITAVGLSEKDAVEYAKDSVKSRANYSGGFFVISTEKA